MRVGSEVERPHAPVLRLLPTTRDGSDGPERPRLVVRQAVEESAHDISVRRRGGTRGVEDFRQPAVAPTDLLRRRHRDLAVKLLALRPTKAPAKDERRDDG